MQRRVRGGVGGIHGVRCCSGLESLTFTEIWLLHITLLLSAESKASQLIQLT